MKTKALVLACVFGVTTAFAQDLTSKKGEVFLPEADDWAIGFDASPFLSYAGNLFNSSATPPSADWTNSDMAVYGKMFKDANTAYRAMVRIGMGSSKDTEYSVQDGQTVVDPNVTVTDEMKSSTMNVTLGAGLEKRRGSTRLQGFYGGEAMFSLGSEKDTYTYGNAYSATNTSPTRAFGGSMTEDKKGSTFGLGVRGFIGAELFVLPKISIAAEYGWGIGMSSTGDGEVTTESWDGTAGAPVSATAVSGGESSFGLDTDASGGSLRIMFHF